MRKNRYDSKEKFSVILVSKNPKNSEPLVVIVQYGIALGTVAVGGAEVGCVSVGAVKMKGRWCPRWPEVKRHAKLKFPTSIS
jgi:hypothetical protein